MGIGPGIVTKSAKRPKYKIDAKMRYHYSYHYRKRYILLYDGGGFAFVPKLTIRELWELREMKRQLSPTELQTFYNALCNRSERIRFNQPFPPETERMVDCFISRHPRWKPERNKIGRIRKLYTPYYESL